MMSFFCASVRVKQGNPEIRLIPHAWLYSKLPQYPKAFGYKKTIFLFDFPNKHIRNAVDRKKVERWERLHIQMRVSWHQVLGNLTQVNITMHEYTINNLFLFPRLIYANITLLWNFWYNTHPFCTWQSPKKLQSKHSALFVKNEDKWGIFLFYGKILNSSLSKSFEHAHRIIDTSLSF